MDSSKRRKVESIFDEVWEACFLNFSPKWNSCAELLMPASSTVDDGVNLNRLEFAPISLEKSLDDAMKATMRVLGTSQNEKGKGPVAVVRGVGGGKTRAMVELYKELSTRADMLAVCITYNSDWDASSDLHRFKRIFFGSYEIVYSLGVVCRILSMIFEMKLEDVRKVLETLDLQIVSSHGSFLGDFMSFLAAKKGDVTNIVLLIDETVRAENIMSELFPDAPKDFTRVARRAMLNHKFPSGLHGALVLSCLNIKPVGCVDSNKTVWPFELPERLSSKEIVSEWWLRRGGKNIEVKPPVASGLTREDCLQALELLAETVSALPRGAEIIKIFLEQHLSGDKESLVVTPDLIVTAFDDLCVKFALHYPRLASEGLPPDDIMFDLLYGVKHGLGDKRVTEGIARSLYVNSLKVFGPKALVELHSSIVSLRVALPRDTNTESPNVPGRLMRMFNVTMTAVLTPILPANIGEILEEICVNWLSVMLTVAIKADKKKIKLCDLLRIKLNVCAWDLSKESSALRKLLSDSISLPEEVVEYRMIASTYTHTAEEYSAELDTLGQSLRETNSCAILRSAEGDCWDYGLIFVSSMPPYVHAIVLNLSSRTELDNAESLHKKLPEDFSLPSTSKDHGAGCQYVHYHKYCTDFALVLGKGIHNERSVAHAMMSQPFYAHQTTWEGGSYLSNHCLVLGRSDTKSFLSFNYDLYAAVRGRRT